MKTGTVKWFDKHIGIGFIAPDDGGPEIFTRQSVLDRFGVQSLESRQKVLYETTNDESGHIQVSYIALHTPS